ncbi:MAG: hypothetical protein ACOX9C_04470 [Kiritimatiellia bacterium]|jgi:hypothetical protein
MKTIKSITVLLAFALLLIMARAAIYTNAWDVELGRNPPVVLDVWRGETVALCARTGISDIADAMFLWQSPDMGESWYATNAAASASGDVTAVWTPAMDSGAATYSYFFRVGGDIYRPRGTIKMKGSPGAVPNEVAIPPRTIDFATVVVTNAPWTTPAEVEAMLADIDGGVIEEQDPVAAEWQAAHLAADNPHQITAEEIGALTTDWAATGTVARAREVGVGDTRITASDGEARLHGVRCQPGVYGDGTRIIVADATGVGYNGPPVGAVFTFSHDEDGARIYHSAGIWRIILTPAPFSAVYLDNELAAGDPGHVRLTWFAETYTIPAPGALEVAADNDDALGSAHLSWYGEGPSSDRLVTRPELDDALGGVVTQPDLDEALGNVVTQPDLDARLDDATNAVVASIFSLREANLIVSNDTASIVQDGAVLWSSASGGGVPPAVTNALWESIRTLSGTVATLQEQLAAQTRNWGAYAPDGTLNPDPQHMVYLNTPTTVWAAGFQWATSGGFSVLATTGAVAFASGDSGEMRIGPADGAHYFGYRTGGSVEVGCMAGGITVADDVATIIYPYDSGDFPTLWFAPDLATPWEPMEGVVWIDRGDGTATVTAPATTERGFFRATTSMSYDSEFITTMPANLSAGVFGATNLPPVRYDSTITISSGGRNYRIPAEGL